MNLFTPEQFATGTLVGVNGNAFSLLGYFQDRARRSGWSREDIDKVLAEAKSGDYDNLVATLAYHLQDDDEEESVE